MTNRPLPENLPDHVAAGHFRRLLVYSGGFLTNTRVRRILTLAGMSPRIGLPNAGDAVAVWGARPAARRGQWMADARGVPLVRIEDAFLFGIRPGRAGGQPLGLLIDDMGLHYDPTRPSRLEHILATHPLDDPSLLSRARNGIARLRRLHLSKYNLHDPELAPPEPGYVLVIDQTQGDAAVAGSGSADFARMLATAQAEHPGIPILIRSHPETRLGLRPGHFGPETAHTGVTFADGRLSPWALLGGAHAVYTMSSQLGFEAILAGHRPQIFGQPFYAGWGLSRDELPAPRRGRTLTAEQLFAAAMILFPVWYDPCRDRLCRFEEAVDQLESEARAYRQDRTGHIALHMRAWKRPHLQRFFGRETPLRFESDPIQAVQRAQSAGKGLIVWAGKADKDLPPGTLRIEDGFLRSRGIGAALVPPLSLVADDLGIYYDPGRESRLDRLIATPIAPDERARAERLIAHIVASGLSKYGPLSGASLPALPPGQRILVPGQVEDDASIRLGAGVERTNFALLERVRQENPQAVLIYKPHPDVKAGLRPGAIPATDLMRLADVVLTHADPAQVLSHVDEVWTITSTIGFEALLRGLPVTCLGMPFYAGWGLTRDLGPIPTHRRARPDLAALVHACLIAYPRYLDPRSGLPCPPEIAAERLSEGPMFQPRRLRLLSRLQGYAAGYAHLWR